MTHDFLPVSGRGNSEDPFSLPTQSAALLLGPSRDSLCVYRIATRRYRRVPSFCTHSKHLANHCKQNPANIWKPKNPTKPYEKQNSSLLRKGSLNAVAASSESDLRFHA